MDEVDAVEVVEVGSLEWSNKVAEYVIKLVQQSNQRIAEKKFYKRQKQKNKKKEEKHNNKMQAAANP